MPLARWLCALTVSLTLGISALPADAATAPQLVIAADNHLFVSGPDGQDVRRLSTPPVFGMAEAAWNRNNEILYLSIKQSDAVVGTYQRWSIRATNASSKRTRTIFATDLCCRQFVPVTPASQWFDAPVWSPNGLRAAVTLWTCVNTFVWGVPCIWHSEILVIVTHGDGSYDWLVTSVDGSGPRWSPDGRRLAFERASGIEVIDAATGRPLDRVNPVDVLASTPRWSPDGKQIAFLGSVKDDAFTSANVWVARADGTQPRKLNARSYDPPSWSPDSRALTFVGYDARRQHLAIIGADGKNRRTLINARDQEWLSAPVWSPDGARIAFIKGGTLGAVYTVDPRNPARTRSIMPLATAYPSVQPALAWRPR